MERASIPKFQLTEFFKEVKEKSGKKWDALAADYEMSGRTLRDWARGKYTPIYEAIFSLSKTYGIKLPPSLKKVDAFWYVKKGAHLGGRRRCELYGAPGTVEDRRRAGVISQLRRREDPEKYRQKGCVVRKEFAPLAYSDDLAELVGILLGDGSLTDYQVRITLGSFADEEYAKFVSALASRVLGEKPSWVKREKKHIIDLAVSGVALVESLERIGLKRGNKTKNQVEIPEWIFDKKSYQVACIRGLFDTDGGLYLHKHPAFPEKKIYLGWCFSNHSKPVYDGFYRILSLTCGLESYKVSGTKLYMYRLENIKRYMKFVGSHNSKNIERMRNFENQQSRRGARVV